MHSLAPRDEIYPHLPILDQTQVRRYLFILRRPRKPAYVFRCPSFF